MSDLVLFEERAAKSKKIAIATLNSEKSLNAINKVMIDELCSQLKVWEEDPEIAAVFLEGKGRAFCAGGDIRALYDSIVGNTSIFEEFFAKEYKLDHSIHVYSKPFVVWGNGIVMGGGMGLMQGASFRVVTENTKMAMPEITIGLFPDIGASYFLKKCPGQLGKFLALSGARLNGSECISANLADYYLKDEDKSQVLQQMSELAFTSPEEDKENIDKILHSLKFENSEENNQLQQEEQFIQKMVSCQDAHELYSFLKDYDAENKWQEILQKSMLHASPTSLALIYEQFKRSEAYSLEKCFEMEWIMACQCCLHHDFPEGIRALIVDKDNQPRWNPSHISAVTPKYLNEFFEWDETARGKALKF